MATTVTYEEEFSRSGNQQQQQNNVCPPLIFGPFPYQGPRPPVLKQSMFVRLPRYSGTESIGGATVRASPAGAGEYGNAATTSLLRTLNLGTEPDGHDELAAMMAMYSESTNPPVAKAAATAAMYSGNSSALMAPQPQQIGHGVVANRAEAMGALNTNYSAAEAVAPQHVGHGVAPKHAAAGQEVPNNGDDFSTYTTSLMAPNQEEHVSATPTTMHRSRRLRISAAPDGDQLAPGALDAISASLMGSPGPGAAMDGNPGLELEAMFSPDQYDDNTMFPLEALLGLDDAPVYDAGVDYQQGGAAGGTAGDAAGTSLIADADDNLDVLNDYLFMDSTGDFNNGRK
ncbi:unnamed protein product [Miscanthus lutarioriparius]|uniref:Uncharacterized protein n=1 Tax=Miscanthus lutarioriparius TaxID=422564 RepID=A0A811R5D7_9POAL|nr:unnamed protein product [Miscanthus lutarioriparius]